MWKWLLICSYVIGVNAVMDLDFCREKYLIRRKTSFRNCLTYEEMTLTLVSIRIIPKEFGHRNEKNVPAKSSDPTCRRTPESTCSSKQLDEAFFICFTFTCKYDKIKIEFSRYINLRFLLISYSCSKSDWQVHFGHLHYMYVDDPRITGPISTKLGTKHSWVMRTQLCSNEWTHPFSMGNNKEWRKYIDKFKKFSSLEPQGQNVLFNSKNY